MNEGHYIELYTVICSREQISGHAKRESAEYELQSENLYILFKEAI